MMKNTILLVLFLLLAGNCCFAQSQVNIIDLTADEYAEDDSTSLYFFNDDTLHYIISFKIDDISKASKVFVEFADSYGGNILKTSTANVIDQNGNYFLDLNGQLFPVSGYLAYFILSDHKSVFQNSKSVSLFVEDVNTNYSDTLNLHN